MRLKQNNPDLTVGITFTYKSSEYELFLSTNKII
jgi:hypothetical protein